MANETREGPNNLLSPIDESHVWSMRRVSSNFVHDLCNGVATVHSFIGRTVNISIGPGTSGVFKDSYQIYIKNKNTLKKKLNMETHVKF